MIDEQTNELLKGTIVRQRRGAVLEDCLDIVSGNVDLRLGRAGSEVTGGDALRGSGGRLSTGLPPGCDATIEGWKEVKFASWQHLLLLGRSSDLRERCFRR